jgi:hypothetical protein
MAIAVLVIAQLSGCSMLFMKKAPPNVPQGAWADCSEGHGWPIVDAVVGVSFVLSGIGIGTTVGSDDTATEADRDAARIAGPIYALAGIGLLYSSYVGFKQSNRCQRIHDDAAARGIYGPQPYYPYPPQPYPYPPPQPYPPPPAPAPAPAPAPQPNPPGSTQPSTP